MGQNFKIVAKTLFGFEDVMADELAELGALNIRKGTRMVSFEGDNGMLYKANLACRTAIKVLKPIHSFEVRNEQMLYDGIKAMPWDELLRLDGTFAIDATVHSDYFNHSKYVALKTKDAIADRFVDLYGSRPNVELDRPTLRINIHISQARCTVSLDSSGDSLHLRGYRLATGKAPINEVLAAGLLLQARWRGQSDFLDPMCGSGTILIEAAFIACNIPANIHRQYFAFMDWADYDEELFQLMTEILLKKTREFDFSIKGYDCDLRVVKMAAKNVLNAGLEEYITIEHQDFFDTKKGNDQKLFIAMNPPYDERLSIDVKAFYRDIGDTLKQHYTNTNAWVLTGNLPALKQVGLRTSKKIICYNGSIEARFALYEMYSGSRKASKLL